MGRLVLSRRAGQSVNIGDSMVLTIREVHPKRVWASFYQGDRFLGANWYDLGQIIDIHGPAQGQRGAPCRVTISEINKGHVKLVFDADRSVTIMRSELLP